ncbi:MAG TPA: hypothetical protein VNI78_02240 [Vicinamibacterales bacterium]|nr:hypothetical protein [Vicinamibacterales bacterium]
MLLDAQTLLSDAQAVSADAVSTNIIDLGAVRQIGDGNPLAIVICVDVAADATTGDETYSFEVQTDDNSGFASPTTLIDQDIPRAVLTAGSIHVIPLPTGSNPRLERYLRLNYDVGGTTPSITVTAWVAPLNFVQTAKHYADGITIS